MIPRDRYVVALTHGFDDRATIVYQACVLDTEISHKVVASFEGKAGREAAACRLHAQSLADLWNLEEREWEAAS